jgi:transcriptional regulator with XRE-family HTH domain
MTKKSELLNFGKKVQQIRKSRNFSQEELAERCGLHRTYIGGVERGERNIALINIIKIAEALEISPRDLFGENGET